MILETLLGGVGGGLLRLAPEVMKILDAKNERKHELEMTRLSIEADKSKAADALAMQREVNDGAYNASALQALMEGIKAQATPSGIKWIDGMSSLVRPTVTYAFFLLYAACRIATFILGVQQGQPVLNLLGATWTGEDQSMLASIMTFWFVGRTFDRRPR